MNYIITQVRSRDLENNNGKLIDKYTDIIYNSFIELANLSYVSHTRKSIRELLTSESMVGFIVKQNGKIIAYLFGEHIELCDHSVYYLSYIYIVSSLRHKGIGTQLINKIINHSIDNKLSHIVLTCDMYDKTNVEFYKKFGFDIYNSTDEKLLPIKNNKQHEIFQLCVKVPSKNC